VVVDIRVWGSVVGVATSYKTGRFGVPIHTGGRMRGIFLLFKTVQNDCGVHTATHSLGIEVISRGKVARGVKLTAHLSVLVSRADVENK
jgi:hypothetical protein